MLNVAPQGDCGLFLVYYLLKVIGKGGGGSDGLASMWGEEDVEG